MKLSAALILLGSRWGISPPSIDLCDRFEKVGATRSSPDHGYRGQKGCYNGHNSSDKGTRGFT